MNEYQLKSRAKRKRVVDWLERNASSRPHPQAGFTIYSMPCPLAERGPHLLEVIVDYNGYANPRCDCTKFMVGGAFANYVDNLVSGEHA
jgi:hypothetical protein